MDKNDRHTSLVAAVLCIIGIALILIVGLFKRAQGHRIHGGWDSRLTVLNKPALVDGIVNLYDEYCQEIAQPDTVFYEITTIPWPSEWRDVEQGQETEQNGVAGRFYIITPKPNFLEFMGWLKEKQKNGR